MRRPGIWLVLALIWSAGCAKAPFTTSVLERFGLTAGDLGRVQFFTSEPIVLEREMSRQTRVSDGAELRFRDDMQTEVIEVSEHTPCVVLRVEGDFLLLGFSPKDTHAALWFRAQPQDESAADGRRYTLVALENGTDDESQPFAPLWSKGFLVSWSGQKYHIASGRGAYLLYELSDDSKRRKVEKSPPGWRLSDRTPRTQPTPQHAEPEPEPETPHAAAQAEGEVSVEVEP